MNWKNSASSRPIDETGLRHLPEAQVEDCRNRDADDNKNAETIALNAYGDDPAQVRMTQYFLGQSPWPYLPLRAELACWVEAVFGDDDGVLSVDESGFAKCGDKSVGMARQ